MEPENQSISKNDVPYQFVERVLIVSLPTALMLIVLVLAGEVEVISAVSGFAMVVFSTIVLALPFLTNLKNVTQYVHTLAQDEKVAELPKFGRNDEETVRIVAAINEMRNIWTTKTEQLEAQTLSDAAVLDSLPDPLLMFNENGEVIGVNLASRHLFGFHVRGELVKTLFDSQMLAFAVERILNKETRKESMEIYFKDKVFNVKIERLPAKAKEGALAVLTLYDMTAQKQFEQMQVDFIANASHELRTPLSVLLGFIETLQGMPKEDEESKKKFLDIMLSQATRMSGLIESLLCLSRLQISEVDVLEKQIDIKNILKEIEQLLETKADKNDINLVLKYADVSGVLMGDESQLQQVFQNLIDNAIKYGQSGGKVTVTCRVEDGDNNQKQYVVDVHNTGKPIPEKSIPHLFERFYRVSETKGKAIGTGLGLSIVQEIVKRHKGNIKVVSSNETGTVFSVFLPIYPEQADSEPCDLESAEALMTAD